MGTTSIREVARRAEVSVGTVSNVLNRPDRVAVETRRRVEQAIDELGFVRNESARQLRAGRSRTIALVVLDISNPFFTDIGRGVEEVAEANGAVVTLLNSGEDVRREARQLAMVEEQRVMGLLITPIDDNSGDRLDLMSARGLPIVLVDRSAGETARCSVAVDDVLGGRLAGEHLLERGHRSIAFVGGPASIRQVVDRRSGLEKAVARVRGARVSVVETPALTVAAGRDAVQRIAGLPASRRPTAVFCANDLLALGVLQEVMRRGLEVPGDVAIVGYDDIEFAAAAAVPLSSVRQPRELLGRTAAQLLLDEVNDAAGHEHEQRMFEPELVVRDSSAYDASAARRRRRAQS
jgi:DNA-binding LacI/PurR family transcriptional regulator